MAEYQTTHAHGCWYWSPRHYECAIGQVKRLEEALLKLEGREQRDKALLQQALEVLERARQTAMEQTLKARIPECGEFAGIAQDLGFIVAALRERLMEKT